MNAKWTHKINDTSGVWLFEPICEQSIWFGLWLFANIENKQSRKKQTISLKIVRIPCDEEKRVSQRTFYGINSTFTRIAVHHAEKGRLM